ncbi:MAG: adenosylcobalamin-dependent ribonucleoside-diphosphate reductase [Gammaproteobacteria bacterium]|nr:adenosylcobalamin-dependent ribonucleoside-diphosphate reductase [Gammaproteobacteria bacterium]
MTRARHRERRPRDELDTPLARLLWAERYAQPGESDIAATRARVAAALAAAEPRREAHWRTSFAAVQARFRFLPAGRILAHAGLPGERTLNNCFVMGALADDATALDRALDEGLTTMQQGGGVGYDFSTLAPAADGRAGGGPLAQMARWDAACAALDARARRGAMMATLRCDHPDIAAFVEAKQGAGALAHFNISVQISDAFVRAVAADRDWPLVFPAGGTVYARVQARALWARIAAAAHAGAEPGVLFVDRVNAENNLGDREVLGATNPCGEIPLPHYGACVLGSVNLVRFVRAPFSRRARFDFDAFAATVGVAVRLLDDVVEVGHYPLAAQRAVAQATRRVGLGVTGLGDALVMLGLDYAGDGARAVAGDIARRLRDAAYAASVALAREKGPFPHFAAAALLARPFVARLPGDLREAIASDGLRNSHLLAIAPAGSISLLAGNVSSGIEPPYAARYRRRLQRADGSTDEVTVEDYACRLWRTRKRGRPPAWTHAEALSPAAHLAMQAVFQPYVDNAISKTINLAASATVDDVATVFARAHELGLKGVTVYRAGGVRGAVLASGDDGRERCPPDA